jgi:hypothetical protein
MLEWEYRKLFLNQHSPRGDVLDLLNAAGTEGWELVGITGNNIAYLKRPIGAPPERIAAAHTGRGTEPELVGANGNNAHSVQGAVVKYRDPATKETWSGRGRMPNWLKRKQEAGEDIEEYLV